MTPVFFVDFSYVALTGALERSEEAELLASTHSKPQRWPCLQPNVQYMAYLEVLAYWMDSGKQAYVAAQHAGER